MPPLLLLRSGQSGHSAHCHSQHILGATYFSSTCHRPQRYVMLTSNHWLKKQKIRYLAVLLLDSGMFANCACRVSIYALRASMPVVSDLRNSLAYVPQCVHTLHAQVKLWKSMPSST